MSQAEIEAEIKAIGDAVRALKDGGAGKDEIVAKVRPPREARRSEARRGAGRLRRHYASPATADIIVAFTTAAIAATTAAMATTTTTAIATTFLRQVGELNVAKKKFEEVTGKPFDPPKKDKKSR